ncbi:hypothetical protein EVG20_g2530 [Dentipellis fragilis]|uniref:Flavin reductase like domain-containing protein n=1 Tax=Dentipellis fragilis TaxID=205917 RepID=A0A4Y9Z9K6_9AGAM|nr:hypothetical protein EVG20_g2530 [Dentipellis fragilis]
MNTNGVTLHFSTGSSWSAAGALYVSPSLLKLYVQTEDGSRSGSTVVPRPIAFVSTESATGERNLAPFSFFNVVSNSPPILSISVLWDGANAKDTLHNIIGTKEFMMNLISEPFVEAANATAVGAPPDFDEWKIAGLTPEPSVSTCARHTRYEYDILMCCNCICDVWVSVKPARVKESAASFECELLSSQDIFPDDSQTPSATLVLGRIKHAYVRKAVLHDDEPVVDATNFQAVARMGGRIYARVGNLYELVMPDWREAV